MFQSARLELFSEADGVEDPRLPAVPELAARVRLERGFHWIGWDGLASLGFRYTGATHLSFDPALDRRTGGHTAADASMSWARISQRALKIRSHSAIPIASVQSLSERQ